MSDDQKIEEQKPERPKVTTNVLIFNSRGEIFLMRSPKWSNLLLAPGGHVEYGETIEQAAEREIREEVGFEIADLELLRYFDIINSPEFRWPHKHFLSFDLRARLVGDDDQKPVLDEREASEYLWITPAEAIKRSDLEATTRETIDKCILRKDPTFAKATAGEAKHSFFQHHFCKDCEKHKKEAEEYKHGWQRALADYKNLQTEVSKRRGEWAQMSETQILEEFIPIYDNFKMAFSHLPLPEREPAEGRREWEQWAQGIEHIKKQFSDILKSHGVEEIKTVGEKFDPKYHEAVGHEEVEGKPEGEIIKEISGGYKVGERVMRAARVIIVK